MRRALASWPGAHALGESKGSPACVGFLAAKPTTQRETPLHSCGLPTKPWHVRSSPACILALRAVSH